MSTLEFGQKASPAGQVQLMKILTTLRTAEVSLLTLPAVLTWLHYICVGRLYMSFVVWMGAMALLAAYMAWARGRFLRDEQTMDQAHLLTRWNLLASLNAFAFGFGWAAPFWLIDYPVPGEFSIVYYIVLFGITAGTAAYASAVIHTYISFLLGMWVVAAAGLFWMFPDFAKVLLFTSALFCHANLRHAQAMHSFMVRQIHLEEYSQQIAEKFKTARDQAEDALYEKNLFLSTASHDLRQPVHAMSMLVEAIRLRSKDSAITPLLVDLKNSMNSLNVMFNSLLDLSKLEAGTMQSRAVRVDVSAMLTEVVVLFRELATSRGLQLRVHLPERQAAVWADPVLLRQALVNLAHNALRYTEQGGVLLGLRRRGDDWQVEVWDTGIGIASEEGQQVFTPYYRSEHAWHLDSAGHGVGLAVVARCAKLLQATYGFQSRLGKGSCFWLRISAVNTHASTERIAHPSPVPSPSEGFHLLSGKCLVLDDDLQVVTAWKAMLEDWGVEGRFATTASEAFAHVDGGFVPAAIFCDQRLRSGESGFDVLRALLARCPEAGGAMVSGEFNSPELILAESEGYLVLRKPLDLLELHAVLATWLGRAE